MNLKSIAFVAIATLALLCSCGEKYDDSEIIQRLDRLENSQIASIDKQIKSIESAIKTLQGANTSFEILLNQLSESGVRSERLDSLNLALNRRIDALQQYVTSCDSINRKWVEISFSTLEQYQMLADTIAMLKANINVTIARMNQNLSDSIAYIRTGYDTTLSDFETLLQWIVFGFDDDDDNFDPEWSVRNFPQVSACMQSLSDSIEALESKIQGWVNGCFDNYYTIATIDAKLSVLDSLQRTGHSHLLDSIIATKNSITEAYQNAIAQAITNGGIIDVRINQLISDSNASIDQRICDINEYIQKLEYRILQLEQARSIDIELNNISDNEADVQDGDRIEIQYKIVNASENAIVTASSDGNYKVEVNTYYKKIIVTCPTPYVDGFINIMLFDGGFSCVKVIHFYQRQWELEDGPETYATNQTQAFGIPISLNFPFKVSVANDSQSWISIPATKAEMSTDMISVVLQKNEGSFRTGTIHVFSDRSQSSTPIFSIQISQAASTLSMEYAETTISKNDQELHFPVVSELGVKVLQDQSSNWLTINCQPTANPNEYDIHLRCNQNTSDDIRTADLTILSGDGTVTQGKFRLHQDYQDEILK